MLRRPPRSTLFPYTTLFRSNAEHDQRTFRPQGVADLATDDPAVVIRNRDRNQRRDRKSTRLNSSHRCISYAVFCLKKKKQNRRALTHFTASSTNVPSHRDQS